MLTNLFILMVIHTLAWAWSRGRGRLDSLLMLRGVGLIAVAVVSLPASREGGMRAVIVAVLAIVWGLRLASHHIQRERHLGPDRRLRSWLETHGAGGQLRALWGLFLPQAVLVWACAFPVQRAIMQGVPLPVSALDLVGVVAVALGLGLETLSDHRLLVFRMSPGGEERVLEDGPWAYSRHPNHFGTLVVSVGFYLLAASAGDGLWSAVGPLLTWVVLTRISGGRVSEAGRDRRRPGYARYRLATSPLVPRAPRDVDDAAMPAETLRFFDPPGTDSAEDLTEG